MSKLTGNFTSTLSGGDGFVKGWRLLNLTYLTYLTLLTIVNLLSKVSQWVQLAFIQVCFW